MALGRDHICWHQPEDARAAPSALTAPRGRFGIPFSSEQLLCLSSTSSAWKDTGKKLFQIFSYQREGGARREVPLPCSLNGWQAPAPGRYAAAPEVISRFFSITDRRRGGQGGKAVLSLHTPSPEPSPHPRFPQVAVPTFPTGRCGSPAARGSLGEPHFCARIFPQPGQDFPNPQRPSIVKVKAYLSSAAHPAGRADAWTPLQWPAQIPRQYRFVKLQVFCIPGSRAGREGQRHAKGSSVSDEVSSHILF